MNELQQVIQEILGHDQPVAVMNPPLVFLLVQLDLDHVELFQQIFDVGPVAEVVGHAPVLSVSGMNVLGSIITPLPQRWLPVDMNVMYRRPPGRSTR